MPRPNRRAMITGAAFVLVAVGSSIANAAEPKIIAGPMVTGVKNGDKIVWFQMDRPGIYGADAHGRGGGCKRPLPYVRVETISSDRNIYRYRYSGNKVVELAWAEGEDAEQKSLDWKPLTGPIPEWNPDPMGKASGQTVIAFGSCSHQERFAKAQPIWSAIAKEKPDCFLFIGDNMYLPNSTSDFPKSRDEVFKLFCDTYDRERQLPEMQPLLRSTMSFALWDDHDYGPNNSDRTWQWKDVALEAFKLYFPGEYGLPDAPGCFRKISWGDIDVFMLDDRTFRDPNKDENRKTMFGEKQLAWLKEGLAASTATFKLVVCGNQMLSDAHPHESWGIQFRPERDAFLRWLWDAKIEGVIFLAGDRHFAELICKKDPLKKGADLWELTSSPLANDSYKMGNTFPDPDRRESYVEGPNFGLLEFSTGAQPPKVTLKLKDEKGKTIFRRTITRKP